MIFVSKQESDSCWCELQYEEELGLDNENRFHNKYLQLFSHELFDDAQYTCCIQCHL